MSWRASTSRACRTCRKARSSGAPSSASPATRCSSTSATRARARSPSRSSTGSGILPKVGEEIEVYLEAKEDSEGLIVLSKDKADKIKVWDVITQAYEKGAPVEGRVVEVVKGGLAVDVGVKAFLPGSQVDLRPVKNLDSMIGQTIRAAVIKLNRRRGNVVLSRRVVLEEEREEKKKHTLAVLAEGMVLDRHREEHHRLRRLHRPRRHRRPAARHRHVVGPDRPSLRDLPGGRPGRGRRAPLRPRDRPRLARATSRSRSDPVGAVDERFSRRAAATRARW